LRIARKVMGDNAALAQGAVMPDELDWDFSGPDDAKAVIRAAVRYLLEDAAGATVVTLFGRSSGSWTR
jgi:hypothetical protein